MSVQYRIRHGTVFTYERPVSVCHNTVCLSPRSGPRQRVQSARLVIEPRPDASVRRTDAFGNIVHVFSIETAHERMSIHATCRVTMLGPARPEVAGGPPWEQVAAGVREQTDPRWLEACPFTLDSPLVRRSAASRAYGAAVLTPGRPILEAAMDLTRTINGQFVYDTAATHVATGSEEALGLRRGVCQDFAHVQLAALRSLGVPARYVSGYLRTEPPPGQPRLVGADESHAWVAVYGGPDIGWVDLDPTNAVACGTDHVTIATGRDYTDVAPVRGVFLGGGRSTLAVEVDVLPVEPGTGAGEGSGAGPGDGSGADGEPERGEPAPFPPPASPTSPRAPSAAPPPARSTQGA